MHQIGAGLQDSRRGQSGLGDAAVVGLEPKEFGGPGRVRTVDLFHAMEARSQLRHRPIFAADWQAPDRETRPWRGHACRKRSGATGPLLNIAHPPGGVRIDSPVYALLTMN